MALMLRLFVIAVVIAGSVLFAPMRGQLAGLSQIEICSDLGIETLTLDARGNPVGPHHPCPDCTACVATGPLPGMTGAAFTAVALPLAFALPQSVAPAGTIVIQPAARDPPLPV